MNLPTKHLPLLGALVLAASCVDMDDATTVTTLVVQVQQPADFVQATSLAGKIVSLQLGGQTLSAQTDETGRATFQNVTPDVYTLSTTWTLTGAEYAAATGTAESVSGATVSGSLNSVLVTGQPLTLATSASPDRDIVIGKVYYAGSRDRNNRNYMAGKYIELYNQSDEGVDVSGLYIGLLEAESTPAYTLTNLRDERADSVVLLKQLFRIPADAPHLVAPGSTVVLCNSAIDHRPNASQEPDLSGADFEAKDVRGSYQNNPATPALEVVYNMYAGTSIMNLVQSGPVGIVIFRTEEDVTQWERVYRYGKTAGSQWLLCPVRLVLDGMEALANKPAGFDLATKRLYDRIDAGYTYINATAGWNGEAVYRKTQKRAAAGHAILTDTNNSTNDFQTSTTIQPREYDQ